MKICVHSYIHSQYISTQSLIMSACDPYGLGGWGGKWGAAVREGTQGAVSSRFLPRNFVPGSTSFFGAMTHVIQREPTV